MKPFPCIESTVDVTHDIFTVRLWIDRQDIPARPDGALVGLVETALRQKPSYLELVSFLVTIPHLNAVQVLQWPVPRADEVAIGTVVYTVPFEDVHG